MPETVPVVVTMTGIGVCAVAGLGSPSLSRFIFWRWMYCSDGSWRVVIVVGAGVVQAGLLGGTVTTVGGTVAVVRLTPFGVVVVVVVVRP
jgi:hypothetical protein